MHKFDIIWLSESYLNSEILSNDNNLQMTDYNCVRIDDLSNTKGRGVCVCTATDHSQQTHQR